MSGHEHTNPDAQPCPQAAFLSPECERIVQVIFERGPVAAKVIQRAAKVDRTRCYVLLSDLKARGLIHDEGDGYELATLAALPSVIGLSQRPCGSSASDARSSSQPLPSSQ